MSLDRDEGFYLDVDAVALSIEAHRLHACRLCPTIIGTWDDFTINGVPGLCRDCYVRLTDGVECV